ncbi:hypothetical protein [Nocardia gipuzkoensis]
MRGRDASVDLGDGDVGGPDERPECVANTKTGRRPGDATDDWCIVNSKYEVKVPINTSYDDKPSVKQLPKTEDGRYYIDSANQSLNPVNPRWEFSHNS